MSTDRGAGNLDRSRVLQLAVAVFVLLAGGSLYLAFIQRFGVDVLFWDEWEFVDRYRAFTSGRLSLWQLVGVRHTDHLMTVPFGWMLLQHVATGFSSKSMQFTGGVFQILALVTLCSLLVARPARYHRTILLVTVCAGLMLCIGQYRNILWGFQLAWFMIGALLVGALAALTAYRATGARAAFALAAIFALLASFSSTHGLLVWISCAIFLLADSDGSLAERFRRADVVSWLVLAVLTASVYAGLYLKGGAGISSQVSLASALASPWTLVKFFLGHLGALAAEGRRPTVAILAGVVASLFLALALLKVWQCRAPRDFALPLALITFASGFAALVTIGRAPLGVSSSVDLRYTAYLPFLLIGVLLILFHVRHGEGLAWTLVRWTYGAFIAISVVLATQAGLVGAKQWRLEQGLAAVAARSYQTAPQFRIERLLFGDAQMVRRESAFLRAGHLNVFALKAEQLPAETWAYVDPPDSLAALIDASPSAELALKQLWDVYAVGSDLRAAFDVFAPDFAPKLVQWGYGASVTGDHYLSQYLTPYRGELEAVWKRIERK